MQLTPAFFQLPSQPAVFPPVSFPLPASVKDMEVFLVSENAIVYRAGVAELIKRLKAWAQSRDPKIPFDHDAEFLKGFEYSGTDKEMNGINFRLFSDGIEKLNNIVQKLESNKDLPINVDEIIAGLISHLNVCAPGCYIHLCKALMALQTRLVDELLTIRQSIVEVKAGEIVERNRDNLFVNEAGTIHFVYSLVNLVVEKFGIRTIEDDLSAHGSPVFGGMKEQFLRASNNFFIGVNPIVLVVNHILKNIDFDNILKNITKPDYSDNFEEHLNKYGPDASFNIRLLFDDNALAEGIYIPQPHAQQRLRITLLNRLMKSGFIVFPITMTEFPNDGSLSYYFNVKNGLLESADEQLYHAFLSGKNIQQTLSTLHPDLFNDHAPLYSDTKIAKRSARLSHALKQLRADVYYHLTQYSKYPGLHNDKQTLLHTLLEPSDNPKILRLAPACVSEYADETTIYLKILAMFSYEERIKILSLAPTHATWITDPIQAGLYLSFFPEDQWSALIYMTPSLRCVTTASDLINLLKQLPQQSRMTYLSLVPGDVLVAMIIAEKSKLCELLNLIPANHWGQAPLTAEYIRELAHIASTPLILDKNPIMSTHFSAQVGARCQMFLLLNSLNPESAQKLLTYFHFEGMHVYQLGLILLYLDLDKWPFLIEQTRELLFFQNQPQLRSALESFYTGSPDKMRQFISLLSTENVRNLCKSCASMQQIIHILPPHALPAWIEKVGLDYLQSIVPSFAKYRELIRIDQVVAAGPELLKSVFTNIEDWKKLLSYHQPYLNECLKVLPAEFLDQTFKSLDELDWVMRSSTITNNTLYNLLSAFSKEHLYKLVATPDDFVKLANRLWNIYPELNCCAELFTLLGGKHLRAISANKNLFYSAMGGLIDPNNKIAMAFYFSVILNAHPDMMLSDLLQEYGVDKQLFEAITQIDHLVAFLKDKSIKQCSDIFRTLELSFWEQRIRSPEHLLFLISYIWRPSGLVLLKKFNPEILQAWFSAENIFELIALFVDDQESYYELGPFLMKSLRIFDSFEKIAGLNRGQLFYVINLDIVRTLVTTPEQLVTLLQNQDVHDWIKICAYINYKDIFKDFASIHLFLSSFLDTDERAEFIKELIAYDTPFSLYLRKLIFGVPENFAQLFELMFTPGLGLGVIDFDVMRVMLSEPSNIRRTLDACVDDKQRKQILKFMYTSHDGVEVKREPIVIPMDLPPYSRLIACAYVENEAYKISKELEEGSFMHSWHAAGLLKRMVLLLEMKALFEVNVTSQQISQFVETISHDRVYLMPLFKKVRGYIPKVAEENIEVRGKRPYC